MTADTKTCDRCGSGIPGGASTCPNCGAPVGAAAYETRKVDAGWSELEVPQAAEPPPPAYEPTIKVPEVPEVEPVPPLFTPQTPIPTAFPEAPKRNRIWPIVGGCVALLVICCCLAVVAGVVIAYQTGAL